MLFFLKLAEMAVTTFREEHGALHPFGPARGAMGAGVVAGHRTQQHFLDVSGD